MSQTLTMVTGEQFLVRNTFIDGPMHTGSGLRRSVSDPVLRTQSSRNFEEEPQAEVTSQELPNLAQNRSCCFTCVSLNPGSEAQSSESCTSPASKGFQNGVYQESIISKQITAVMHENDPSMTTVVAKNLPSSYTKHMLVEMLNACGFQGKYDFVYLPFELANQRLFGFAFINFVTHEDALEFGKQCNGVLWAWSTNIGTVEWSGGLHGLDEHIQRYRNSPIMHKSLPDGMKPTVFRDGVEIQFPPSTKWLKAPRSRKYVPGTLLKQPPRAYGQRRPHNQASSSCA